MDGMPFEGPTGEKLRKALLITVVVLAIFLAVEVVGGIKQWRYIGAGLAATNTISVQGHGELLAVPDIATFTYSVVSDKTTVADAQTAASALANAITTYLKGQGIDSKDIQTTDYSVSPQYDFLQSTCPASPSGVAVFCPPGKQVLRGYEVRQSTTVKVRDTTKAGDLLTGVGGKGATEVSGLNFTFDDPAAVQNQARDKAIADAKQKAETLAKSLGVTLVRVTSFSENGVSPRAPIAFGVSSSAVAPQATAPEISVGQNTISDDVTITYEIQ